MSRILSGVARGSGLPFNFVNRKYISWIQCCCTYWPYLQYQWFALFMSDWADSILQNSYQTGSPSTPSLTPPLISSPRQGSVELSNLPCDLTSVFERPALHSSVTMTNLANQLPSYDSDAIAQANISYFCLHTGRIPVEIERNQVVVKKEIKGEECSN